MGRRAGSRGTIKSKGRNEKGTKWQQQQPPNTRSPSRQGMQGAEEHVSPGQTQGLEKHNPEQHQIRIGWKDQEGRMPDVTGIFL